jgi:hypothetical protein
VTRRYWYVPIRTRREDISRVIRQKRPLACEAAGCAGGGILRPWVWVESFLVTRLQRHGTVLYRVLGVIGMIAVNAWRVCTYVGLRWSMGRLGSKTDVELRIAIIRMI